MNQIVTRQWTFNTIGIIHSPCKEKFAVPRQSGLAPELLATIEILKPYDRDEAFISLEGFSHIWVLGIFHQSLREDWQPTVRPPRLGGKEKVGVFASRSPFRPNPVSLSVFKLEGIERRDGKLYINVSGIDLVNETPVIDIKPYVEYADRPSAVISGYTDKVAKPCLSVEFTETALQQCRRYEKQAELDLQQLITRLIALDPRPAYRIDESVQQYGLTVYEFNVSFEVQGQHARIISVLAKV